MSEKDKSSHPHQPMKLIFIFIVWLLALYAAVLIVKNSESSPELPPLSSRPPMVPVKHKGVCKSPECITLAHQLHNWRDVSVDPCQDFYKAVCGKFSEHSLAISAPSKQGLILKQLLKEFLIKKETSTSKSENDMRTFYEKCELENTLNETEINKTREDYVFQMMRKIGSFPILDKNWTESKFDLNDILSKMTEFGGYNMGFFSLQFHIDPLMLVLQPGFVLPGQELSLIVAPIARRSARPFCFGHRSGECMHCEHALCYQFIPIATERTEWIANIFETTGGKAISLLLAQK